MTTFLIVFACNYLAVGMFLVWVMLGYLDHNPAAARLVRNLGLVKCVVWLLLFWPHALLYCFRQARVRRDG